MNHELKTEAFDAILSGEKTHEIGNADRAFSVGDTITLREWHPAGGYTGRVTVVTVTYLTPHGEWGLPSELCVMSIRGDYSDLDRTRRLLVEEQTAHGYTLEACREQSATIAELRRELDVERAAGWEMP